MIENEKDLLLQDLCCRLPYDVKCKIEMWKGFDVCTIYNINSIGYVEIVEYSDSNGVNIERIKPYLFPLSSMTEEQKKQLKQHTCPDGTGYFDGNSLCCPVNHFGENIPFEFMARITDWLRKHHFDIYGLIPKGLALDATGLNVY